MLSYAFTEEQDDLREMVREFAQAQGIEVQAVSELTR